MLKRGVLSGRPLSGIEAEFKSITDLIDRITQSVKRISRGLRPEALEDMGIVEAIRYQVQEFAKRNNIECEMHLPSMPPFIDSTVSITLFRIVQEALTNIMRHAQAKTVRVSLEVRDDVLILNVQDDGVGISVQDVESSKSLGLIGLRERVRSLKGRFSISGGAGDGTCITVMLPIHSENLQPEYDKYDQDYHS
jgi:signal transduction histidine kinase